LIKQSIAYSIIGERKTLNKKATTICILIATCLLVSSVAQLKLGFATDMPSPAWTTRTSMPTATGQAAVITGDNGLIYVTGGFDGSDPPTALVQAYNPTTNTWSYKTSLLHAIRGAAVAKGPDGLIYVISGWDDSTPYTEIVQAYNATSDSWSLKASIHTPAWMATAATGDDGKIYVFGGEDDDTSYSNKTQIYNTKTDTWTNGTDMPTGRQGASAVKASDGLIYVIGGYNGTALSTVEAYNPTTDTWTTKAYMPTPRLRFSAVLGPDNKIYAIGGGETYSNNDPPYYNTVEIYDPRTNTWTTPTWSESLLPTARRELGATLGNNGRIYAIGGANGAYLTTNEEAIITLPENIPPTAYIDSITPNPATAGEPTILTGHGADVDGYIIAYKWRSSTDGTIGTSATLNISTLSTSVHNIYFSVKDNSGAWSPEATATLTVANLTEDPLYKKILDLNSTLNNLQQQNSNLNNKLNNLQGQYDNLTSKLDNMTYELLGTGIITIILIIAIIAVIFIPPKRKTPPTTTPST